MRFQAFALLVFALLIIAAVPAVGAARIGLSRKDRFAAWQSCARDHFHPQEWLLTKDMQ